MKKIVMSFAILMALLFFVSCGQHSQQQAAPVLSDSIAELSESVDAELAPDFELPDLQGNPLKLSSLRGKYVVLDFWGSWCIWCIRGIPHMKEAYSKYKEKMEILGIDCNDSEEDWRSAVSEHQLPWLQVRCPEDQMESVANAYHIEGFPTKVVIDPEGRIVKVIVGEDPAFYTYLDELFAK